MTIINYNNKIFKSVQNSENGDVNGETTFYYKQEGNKVWASYSGGGILLGNLIALVDKDGCLDMRYHHINANHELMTGVCKSVPEVNKQGKVRLHEDWQWTCSDYSKGKSIVEEQ